MKPEDGSRILALVGPTGVGKTAIATIIAGPLDAQIVSVDSMQVYRGMNIGTAKPSEEERSRAEFHLLDVADVTSNFSVAEFKSMADDVAADIIARGLTPLLCGGSGLYYRAIVDDLDFSNTSESYREELEEELADMSDYELHLLLSTLDPAAAAQVSASNRRRVLRAIDVARRGDRLISEAQHSWSDFSSSYDLLVAGLDMERHVLYRLLDMRVEAMVREGLEGEVRSLKEKGLERGTTAGEALGYRQMLDYLAGDTTFSEAIEETKKRTRNLARRQLTWFRKDPRVRWFNIPAEHHDSADVIAAKIHSTSGRILEYFSEES